MKCELLGNSKSTVCGLLWCIARQALRCCVAISADAGASGSVMEVMQRIIVREFKWAVSSDDMAEECGMGWR
jgi:hypothetical protein